MNRARRIRTAFVAAMLLVQVALPALHGIAFGDEDHRSFAAAASPSIAPASGAGVSGPSHDPSACPFCLASRQGRTGIVRTSLNVREPSLVVITPVCERPLAPPSEPRLDCASPRAPPISALVFA